ncbi:MAG: DUF6067 family protein [Spirochaetaceae bacterium]|nr:DUF6067 family protein [Spirochaetaceae bacterium]
MKKKGTSPRQITLCAYARFDADKLHVTVVSVGDAFISRGAAVDLWVWHRARRQSFVRTRIDDFDQPSDRTVVLDLGQVPGGTCELQAVLVDRWGRECITHLIQSADPPHKPAWWGSRAGLDPGVPADWTALEGRSHADGAYAVSGWGREYRFAPGCLIESVTAAGSRILRAPVRLAAVAGGRSLRFAAETIDQVASAPGEVVLEQRLSAANLDLRVQAHVEFDGMIRFDVEVSAADAVDLDSLSIEIPIRAEHAEYLYHFPGAWGTARNAGAHPDTAVKMGFRPYVWLGDEDRGLAWFSESDRDWQVAPGTPATEIVRDGDRVVLTLHLISLPMRLAPASQRPLAWDTAPELENAVIRDAAITGERGERYQPLRYTFGLQATPVKANEQGAWDYRCIHVGPAPPAFTEPLTLSPRFLDRCVQAGVRTVALHQFWTDIEAHTIPVDRERLREWVEACHDRGLKILLYYGFLISSAAPEWRDFGADCLTMPPYGYPLFHSAPQPDQSAWVVCLNSAWQDFVADAIARAMDEFGIDGVYLDGMEFPAGCINTLHGCGSMRSDGSVAKSYPIFGVRSAMRRIHNAVKSVNPEGQINAHNSTCMVMPTLGFATSYWDGEQFQDVRGIDNAATQLPLDAFRAEFMGRQWGVPAEFLCYGQGFTFEQAWAVTLIHDVPVRPMNRPGLEDLDLASRIWRLMDDFDRGRAEWLPYWRNAEYVRADSPGIYVSIYRHPGNGVLAVVSNLNRERTAFALTVNWDLLGMDHATVAIVDGLERSPARLHGALDPYGWRLLWLRPLNP